MLLRERAVDLDELEPDELQPALLEPREDAADELALDAVGLDEEERALEYPPWEEGLSLAAPRAASRSW